MTRPQRSRRLHRWDEAGSAVVVAVVIAAIVAGIATATAARTASDARAALAAHDRALARATAEHVLLTTLAGATGTAWGDDLTAGRPVDRTLAVTSDGPADARLGAITATVRPDIASDLHRLAVRVETPTAVAEASAVIRPLVSADLLWITEHRALDPALQGLPRASCVGPPGSAGRDPACRDVPVAASRFDGAVHANEGLVLDDGTTIAAAASSALLTPDDDGTPVPTLGPGAAETLQEAPFALVHRQQLRLPRDVSDIASPVVCRFRGPTLLRLDGPMLHVRSPRSVPRGGESNGSEAAIGCPGLDRTRLADGATVVLPSSAVVEVVGDDVQDCVAHPLGIPPDEDTERTWSCTAGDAFVWGRYAGRRTIRAEGDIQIVWDVEPRSDLAATDGDGPDLLGLVAGDSIVLRRPVGPAVRRVAPFGRNLPVSGPGVAPFADGPLAAPTVDDAAWEAPRIVAALTALRGSIGVQNPFRGEANLGPITVVGSMAARFPGVFNWDIVNRRGDVVATTGYELELVNDARLESAVPPGLPHLEGGGLRIVTLDVG